MHARTVIGTVALAALSACRDAPLPEGYVSAPVDETWPSDPGGGSTPRETRAKRQQGECGTLTDAEDPDVLRFVVAGASARTADALVLYANAQVGLAIVDVTEPDDPRLVATSRFEGEPIGVFERPFGAVVVFAPWDRPSETIVRAVSLAPRRAGQTIGEVALPGAPRSAHRVGDAIVVTRDLPAENEAQPVTAVTTFVLDADGLAKRDELRLPGRGAVTAASPHGVAVAREAAPELGANRTSVTWIGVAPDELGVQRLHGTATIDGVVPRWRRTTEHVIDAAEDGRVRVVGCATAACPPDDLAAYASIDFAEPDRPRVTSWSLIGRAGNGVFAFVGERLVVARPPADRTDTTELVVFRTHGELAPAGMLRVRGTVASIPVRQGQGTDAEVLALGWTGSASAGKRAIIHQVDARKAPRLVGSLSFGGDWTWSPAYDDDRAVTFDPTSTLAALPMTTLRGRSGAVAAAQVLALGPTGPRTLVERQLAVADRLLFVDGRLLAFSADGVVVVRQPGERRIDRRWDDRATVR